MTENSNGVIILITLLNILVYKLQQLQEAKFTEQTNQLSLDLGRLCRRFSLRDIQWATFDFNDELVIGQGGFGKVYKGIIDFGASIVAIKRLKSTSKQGSKEFLTEIEMLSKFQHSHVVSLVGYCDDCHEMILVYEYMPCGTLADHLHKRVRNGDTSSPPLSWEQRLKICIGAARGLEYLHTGTSVQHRVIHRDVKSSNILLDENRAAKISDFGLSKIGPSNQAFSTYVSTNVKGTPGYMDPYYFETHRLTRKSDVYGFGVVLFEVLCGRPAVDNRLDEKQRGLAGWAQHCFKEGLLDQIIDPSIKGKIFPDSLVAFVRVAIHCLHHGPKHRPTMAEVVVGLESALALQESSTIYILPEWPLTNCSNQVNVNANSSSLEGQIMKYNQEHVVGGNQGNFPSPIVEVENANHNQENKNSSLEKGVINDADGGHHDEQSPARTTFTEKASLFLWGRTRMFSVVSDALGAFTQKRRGTNRGIYVSANNSTHMREPGSTKFTMEEIYKATRNFSPNLKIGEGGFGSVYKGQLEDGTFVAVKRAKKSVNDKHLGEEFQSEIKMLAQVEHLNLVKYYGYLEHEDERIVVVEYVTNGTLREHLEGMHGTVLDFATRLDVAIYVAHAVTYLHMYTDHPIIHRDIKSSNILVTENFRAKVADFGFARLATDSESGATHVSTRIKGTAGYLDPEYLRTFQLTEKSDVYSFGVLLVELVTGRRPIEVKRELKERITTKWAMKKFADGDAILTLDPRLNKSPANNLALEKIFELALQCLATHRQNRPKMRRCGEILWSIRKDYRELLESDVHSLSSNSQRGILTREEQVNVCVQEKT